MTEAQIELLIDKLIVWRRAADRGPTDFRDYNARAADALMAALRDREMLLKALRNLLVIAGTPITVRQEQVFSDAKTALRSAALLLAEGRSPDSQNTEKDA